MPDVPLNFLICDLLEINEYSKKKILFIKFININLLNTYIDDKICKIITLVNEHKSNKNYLFIKLDVFV